MSSLTKVFLRHRFFWPCKRYFKARVTQMKLQRFSFCSLAMNCIQFLIWLQAFSLACAETVARKKGMFAKNLYNYFNKKLSPPHWISEHKTFRVFLRVKSMAIKRKVEQVDLLHVYWLEKTYFILLSVSSLRY